MSNCSETIHTFQALASTCDAGVIQNFVNTPNMLLTGCGITEDVIQIGNATFIPECIQHLFHMPLKGRRHTGEAKGILTHSYDLQGVTKAGRCLETFVLNHGG